MKSSTLEPQSHPCSDSLCALRTCGVVKVSVGQALGRAIGGHHIHYQPAEPREGHLNESEGKQNALKLFVIYLLAGSSKF